MWALDNGRALSRHTNEQGLPDFCLHQVALMFLVRGPIHHERTWAAWLDDAAGFVPTPAAVKACCTASDGGSNGDSGSGSRQRAASDRRRRTKGQHGSHSDDDEDDAHDGEANAEMHQPAEAAAASALAGAAKGGNGSNDSSDDADDSAAAEAAAHRRLQQQQARRRRSPSSRALKWLPRIPRTARQQQPFGSEGIVAAQRLYSVYVHPAPRFAPYPRGHLFWGLELPRRVKVGSFVFLNR